MTKKEYIAVRNKMTKEHKGRAKQCIRLLDYLWEHDHITRNEGMRELGIANVPEVVRKLRANYQVPVETIMCSGLNRYDDDVRYGEYFIARRR